MTEKNVFDFPGAEIDVHWDCLQTGTPLGNGRFREQIETALGRKVGQSQRGRPRKAVSETEKMRQQEIEGR